MSIAGYGCLVHGKENCSTCYKTTMAPLGPGAVQALEAEIAGLRAMLEAEKNARVAWQQRAWKLQEALKLILEEVGTSTLANTIATEALQESKE